MSGQSIGIVLAELDREISETFEIIETTVLIMTRAVELTRAHALRAADAMQLACALLAREQATAPELILVGSDQELNAAAVAEGLSVLDPTQP